MPININCKYNDNGAWCKNLNIKRSLFGLGARCCVLFPDKFLSNLCKYQEKYRKPKYKPLYPFKK